MAKIPVTTENAKDIADIQAVVSNFRAKYRIVAAQSLGATGTIVDFDTSEYDYTGGAITTGFAWKCTVPETGLYEITVSFEISAQPSSVLTNMGMYIFVNGVQSDLIVMARGDQTTTLKSYGDRGSTTIYLTAGQYFDLRSSRGTLTSGGSFSTAFKNNYIVIAKVG